MGEEEAEDSLMNIVAELVAEEDSDSYVQVAEMFYVGGVSQCEFCESYGSASTSAKISDVYESGVKMFKCVN